MRNRNNPVYVRFSDSEYEQLKEKVEDSGQTLQSYIIRASLDAKVPSATEISIMKARNKLLEDIDKQLRGIGTNLNQLAHIANGYGALPTIDKLASLFSEIKCIRKEVNKQWQFSRQLTSQQKLTEH